MDLHNIVFDIDCKQLHDAIHSNIYRLDSEFGLLRVNVKSL